MTFSQDLILTVLPNGQTVVPRGDLAGTYLDFSVIVSARLKSTSAATTTLAHYPDWCASAGAGRSWPTTVAALTRSLQLSLPDFAGAPKYPARVVGAHAPDAARFAAAFPSTTPVTPFVYKGFEGRKIRSAPVGSVVDHLATLYGHFGLTAPTAFPPYAQLIPAASFGAIGFEQEDTPRATGGAGVPGDGSVRKATLHGVLEGALTSAKAIPYDLTALAASVSPPIQGAAVSLAFLQHQQFLQRGLKGSGPIARPTPPVFDFHQMVAALASMPTVFRTFGLVLDLRVGPIAPALVQTWANGVTGRVQVTCDGSVFLLSTKTVLPFTQATFGTGIFRSAPKNPAVTDQSNRALKLGDANLYRMVRVDHDNAVVKTMQFANSVTRSRDTTGKRTPSSPDSFALPALRTGGFAIARSGRAVQMAATLAHQTAGLQDTFFGDGSVTPPPLYEDDLTRGYRIDVLHEADGIWRSLMWREGTVTVQGTDALDVLEEDTVVPSPTTASTHPADPGDLYLQETLTRWDGWSLAVPRLGTPFQDSGPSSSAAGSSGFNVTTDWHVPGSSPKGAAETSTGNALRLPRLRFGQTYRLRARAADLAGNSLPVENAPTGATVVSPALRHLRFEPIPAPRVLLVDEPLPGASEEVVVVRSESATVDGSAELDNVGTTRLVVPAPTSVFMVEQHGAFDDIATQGLPMNQTVALYKDLASRDAVELDADGELVDPSQPHSTANPYVFKDFLPIDYLPEYIGRGALVRNLPINAFKQTVATLPFDTAAVGWPKLQACRISLRRGTTNWTTKTVKDPDDSANVTTELDLTLAKGDMFTTLVNASVESKVLDLLALWEWIQGSAAAEGKTSLLPAVQKAILAGTHWMVTPWRSVTFMHAVRTPLLVPQLFLRPTKTELGQTKAVFAGTATSPAGGTLIASRKSTSRVDVDAAWKMPIDTGKNSDPVTPQSFTGHAFTIELARAGQGVKFGAGNSLVTSVDAENFSLAHEFNDTKFRAIDYRATATSYYVEYFREKRVLSLGADPIATLRSAPLQPGVAFEATTAELTLEWDENGTTRTRRLMPAPTGTPHDAPAPTPGDYVVVEDPALNTDPVNATHGTVQVLVNSPVASTGLHAATVEFSYVGPTIHTFSDPVADKTTAKQMIVANSARPKAPDVLYVVPIYARSTTRGGVTRKGGALRVYLNRPWWSSGDGERLGVLCWHRGSSTSQLPPAGAAPFVTLWGYDPVFKSTQAMPAQPVPACFPNQTAVQTGLSIDESIYNVDVAGHDVGFDADRKLWYCDIRVSGPDGKELKTYTPFIRFAFARYQPNSMHGAHLSKVVVVDWAQLAPNRSVTVSGASSTRTVTVVGRAAVATVASTHASRMTVTVEQRDTRILDDAVAWSPATGPRGYVNHTTLTPTTSDSDHVTWRGEIKLPAGNSHPLRLTFEEFERIPGGDGHGRLAFTESLPIAVAR